MTPYRYIKLTPSEREIIEKGYKDGKIHNFRVRCHALLLSCDKMCVPDIAKLLDKQEKTIRQWMNRWESSAISGLYIQKGRGCKPLLSKANTQIVEEIKKK